MRIITNFGDYLPKFEIWLKLHRGVSFSTFNHHFYNIRTVLSKVDLSNKDDLEDYLIKLSGTKKPGTIENYLFTLRVFARFLDTLNIKDLDYIKDIPLPKRTDKLPNILSVAEIEKILSTDLPRSYLHYPQPREARAIFDTVLSLLSKTGARIGEVLNTKIQDIDWETGVWKLDLTKTRRGRIVPIPPDDLIRLKSLVKDRKPDSYLFVNPLSGNQLSQVNVGENFRRRLKDSGINKSATIHTLRHSFIVEMFKQDVSVLKIANIVGHENIKTTQDYARLLYEDLRDAILRHPMTAKNRNPYDILKHIKEIVDKFHLKEDPRFMFNIDDSNEGLRISIFVR